MIKAKPAKKTSSVAKAKSSKKKAKAPAKSKANWSGAIREALQQKQAPKTWPGSGNAPWKGVPSKKDA